MRTSILLLLIFILIPAAYCQQEGNRPYACGFVINTFDQVQHNYEYFHKFIGCKPGETIASIGAGNGYIEVQIAAFVENVNWYIQDIDTSCCNQHEFNSVLSYYEKLKGSAIQGKFNLVIGDEKITNLPKNTFDRVIFHNSYHEITQRKEIMDDVKSILKPGGEVIIMERVTKKKKELHGDCKMPKFKEAKLLEELKLFSFELINKNSHDKYKLMRYYTFKLNDLPSN